MSIGCIAKRIWLRRNAVIHEGTFLYPNDIVQQSSRVLQEFHQAQVGAPTDFFHVVNTSPIKWMAPPQGWYKANWNASIMTNTGWMGLGVVICDHMGLMCVAKSITRQGFLDPVAAEVSAAFLATQACREMGFMQVILEGDAKIIVDTTNSMESDWSRTVNWWRI